MDEKVNREHAKESNPSRIMLTGSSSHVESELDRIWEKQRQQENSKQLSGSPETKADGS